MNRYRRRHKLHHALPELEKSKKRILEPKQPKPAIIPKGNKKILSGQHRWY